MFSIKVILTRKGWAIFCVLKKFKKEEKRQRVSLAKERVDIIGLEFSFVCLSVCSAPNDNDFTNQKCWEAIFQIKNLCSSFHNFFHWDYKAMWAFVWEGNFLESKRKRNMFFNPFFVFFFVYIRALTFVKFQNPPNKITYIALWIIFRWI